MIEPGIKRYDRNGEYYFREGCFITELSNSADDSAVSVAKARVEVGKTTAWHCLTDIDERYVILAGTGMVEIGDRGPERVGPGDVVLIPRGCRQRISNAGDTDLVFLAICSPRFTSRAYKEPGSPAACS